MSGQNVTELQAAAGAARGPILAALQSLLGVIWRRQVVRFFSFLTSYLTLVSKYSSTKVLGALRVSLEPVRRIPLTKLSIKRSAAPPGPPEACVQCQVLVEPADATADVIFIHGLHGSLRNTWRQGEWGVSGAGRRRTESPARRWLRGAARPLPKNTDRHYEPYANCWPKEWLPLDCPGARVIALNYSTDPYLWRPHWMRQVNRSCMVQRSKEMVKELQAIGVGNRPIVWVGHSKGGLFVKQMLVDEWEHQQKEEANSTSALLPPLCNATKGILFYSVPHRGSALAHIQAPMLSRSVELMEVAKDCNLVLSLHSRFLQLCKQEHFNPEMVSLFETRSTRMSVVFLRIVAQDSADPDIGELCGIDLDHRQICKPRNRECFLYRRLIALIQQASALCDTFLASTNATSSAETSSDDSFSECEDSEIAERSSERTVD